MAVHGLQALVTPGESSTGRKSTPRSWITRTIMTRSFLFLKLSPLKMGKFAVVGCPSLGRPSARTALQGRSASHVFERCIMATQASTGSNRQRWRPAMQAIAIQLSSGTAA
nr:hypothetical protein CFP56_56030 [Quercus suber]